MTRDKKLSLIMKWHRRIGLVMVVAIVIIVLTGISLNHTSELNLSKVNLNNSALLKWYGIEPEIPAHGYEVLDDVWLWQNDSSLWLNDKRVGDCSTLSGGIAFSDLLISLCPDKLNLLTLDGELVESITPAFGLPENTQQLGSNGQQILLQTRQQTISFDINTLEWETYNAAVDWPKSTPLPEHLVTLSKSNAKGLSLETLILDIHSGRVFGFFGVILVDIAALFLLMLALTGFWAWVRYNKTHKI